MKKTFRDRGSGFIMKQKAFTLIELLVVVAIIGILAAVGVVAYNGYTKSAKVGSTKANHKNVCKWTNSELMKCNLDSSVSIFNGQISCSTIISKLSSKYQNPAGDMARALEKGLQDKFKNPYGAYTPAYGDSAVRSSGWNKDRDLGYTIVDTRCCPIDQNGRHAVLNIHTCNELSCGGDPWNNKNDNKEICWIEVRP